MGVISRLSGIAGAAALALWATGALAGEVRFIASAALKPAVEIIAPAFEKASGHKVLLKIANVREMQKEPEKAGFDVTIQSTADVDMLGKGGQITEGSAASLVTSSVGVAVRAGAPKDRKSVV